MNDSYIPEVSDVQNQTDKTPIEVLLHVDNDGTVSAKRVYEFLELNPTHFARWCKDKFLKNDLFEENVDYSRLATIGETPTGGNVERIDYKLTIDLAKRLCMKQDNIKGHQAQSYFLAVENKLKEIAQETKAISAAQLPAITNQIQALETFFSVVKAQQERIEEHDCKLQEYDARLEIQCAAIEELNDRVERLRQSEILVPVEQIINTDVGDLVTHVRRDDQISTDRIARMYGFSAIAFNRLLHRLGIIEKHEKAGWKLTADNRARGVGVQSQPTSKCDAYIMWTPSGRKFLQAVLKGIGLVPIKRLPARKKRNVKAS